MDPRAPGDGTNLGPRLLGVIWFFAVMATTFLSLRMYAKVSRKRALWWDDYLLLVSWCSLLTAIILQSICVKHGLGKHTEDIAQPDMIINTKASYAAGFCCLISLAFSKTSFAVTLLRISTGWTRVAVWFVLITVDCVLIAHATIQWVQCWPTPRLWNWDYPGGTCMDPKVVEFYNTFSTLYSGSVDIILAILPWKIVWSVQINKKEKIGVVIAMSTSIFAGIISFVKIRTHYAIPDPDIVTNVNMFIFGTAEPAMTIIAASIPILRHLFKRSGFSSRPTGAGTGANSYVHHTGRDGGVGVSLRSMRKPEGAVKVNSLDEERILPQYRGEEYSRNQYSQSKQGQGQQGGYRGESPYRQDEWR